jgi:hypothetical protein
MSVSKGNTLLLAVMMAISLAGCASLGLFQTPEERVQHRAQARLDALLAGDIKKAFSFLAPAAREATSWQRWGSKYAGVTQWRAVSVNSVKCDLDRCDVNVSVTYEMFRPRIKNTRAQNEVWIDVNGQWYFYPS